MMIEGLLEKNCEQGSFEKGKIEKGNCEKGNCGMVIGRGVLEFW